MAQRRDRVGYVALSAHVIPLALWHSASVGLELMLAKLAGHSMFQGAALGLARDAACMPETEDHIAYLFEVMRYLIAAELGWTANSLAQQKAFFMAHVQPWVLTLCDALAAHPQANFYAAVSGFTRAFMGVEAQAFDLLE